MGLLDVKMDEILECNSKGGNGTNEQMASWSVRAGRNSGGRMTCSGLAATPEEGFRPIMKPIVVGEAGEGG